MNALHRVRVLEFAGLAPAPMCGMLLADFGADVVRVDRAVAVGLAPPNSDTLARGKRSIALDLRQSSAIDVVKRLAKQADVIIEPYRPGKMEKLGLGPDVLCKENKGLIYARLTGYGQHGPLSNAAGHDINYVSMSGLLASLGRSAPSPPTPPLNLLADMAGGALMCAFGIATALVRRERTGEGAVLDAAMSEGAAYLGSFVFNAKHFFFANPRGRNLLDTGAPFYDAYATRCGGHVAVGALEAQFYAALLRTLGLSEEEFPQFDQERWPALRAALAAAFARRTRDEWAAVFHDVDACVTPVLTVHDAADDAHNRARRVFNASGEVNPSPRFVDAAGRSSGGDVNRPLPLVGQHTREILHSLKFNESKVKQLIDSGAVFALDDAKAAL